MPARNFLPALPGSILSETYTGNGIVLSFNEKEVGQTEMFFYPAVEYTPFLALPPRNRTASHHFPALQSQSILTSKRVPPPAAPFAPGRNIPALHSSRKRA